MIKLDKSKGLKLSMKINGNVVKSTPFFYYKDATGFFAGAGFANTDNFSFSQILDPSLIYQSFTDEYNDKRYLLNISVPELRNKYILINADGVPARNISDFDFKLHRTTGIIKITPDGRHYQILWGFAIGSKPTKFLEQHLAIHNELLKRDKQMTCLANISSPYFQQFSYLDKDNDENKYTFMLWDSLTDLARLIPDGIGIIPLTKAPSREATDLYVEKFKKYNVVVRDKMNVMVAGHSWDDVMAVGQSIERASYNAITIGQTSTDVKYVSKEYWDGLQETFNVKLNPNVLAFAPSENNTADAIAQRKNNNE